MPAGRIPYPTQRVSSQALYMANGGASAADALRQGKIAQNLISTVGSAFASYTVSQRQQGLAEMQSINNGAEGMVASFNDEMAGLGADSTPVNPSSPVGAGGTSDEARRAIYTKYSVAYKGLVENMAKVYGDKVYDVMPPSFDPTAMNDHIQGNKIAIGKLQTQLGVTPDRLTANQQAKFDLDKARLNATTGLAMQTKANTAEYRKATLQQKQAQASMTQTANANKATAKVTAAARVKAETQANQWSKLNKQSGLKLKSDNIKTLYSVQNTLIARQIAVQKMLGSLPVDATMETAKLTGISNNIALQLKKVDAKLSGDSLSSTSQATADEKYTMQKYGITLEDLRRQLSEAK